MKKQKSFDCVQMKWDIQRKLEHELAGTSELEKRRIQMDRVEKNPVLSPFLKRVRKPPSKPSKPVKR